MACEKQEILKVSHKRRYMVTDSPLFIIDDSNLEIVELDLTFSVCISYWVIHHDNFASRAAICPTLLVHLNKSTIVLYNQETKTLQLPISSLDVSNLQPNVTWPSSCHRFRANNP